MFQATREKRYLDLAERRFEFKLRSRQDLADARSTSAEEVA